MKKIYGTVTIGERGQVIIPAEARRDLGIKPKDKLIVGTGPVDEALIIMPVEKMKGFLNKMMQIKSEIDSSTTKEKK